MSAVEPVAGRLQALMATTPVVDRAPIPGDTAAKLSNDLRRLCADTAVRLCADDYPQAASGEQLQQRVLLANITVAEALAAQVALLQQQLWARAAEAGITDTRVAKARGVTQQAQSKTRAQRK